jgi:hypothetical protein
MLIRFQRTSLGEGYCGSWRYELLMGSDFAGRIILFLGISERESSAMANFEKQI